MAVLADKEGIVDELEFVYLGKEKVNYIDHIYGEKESTILPNANVDFAIQYHDQCWCNPAGYAWPYSEIPLVGIVSRIKEDVIMHEIGHLFGLGDTYSLYGRHGDYGIMADYQKYIYEDGVEVPALSQDDIDGLRFLYEHHFEEKQTSCPDNYQLDPFGCKPISLAINNAKIGMWNANWDSQGYDDLRIVDKLGNTAIHYLALRKVRHSDPSYDNFLRNIDLSCEDVLKDGSYESRCKSHRERAQRILGKTDLSIKNKDGLTAADIAAGRTPMVAADVDFNNDNKVNILDLVMLSACVNNSQQCEIPKEKADLNKDGVINQEDLSVVAEFF